jgi:predicted nucleotidyltransferase
MTDEQFLSVVKRTVLAIDPQAEIWLFGSRARGDFRDDSDGDFLVFTHNDLSGGKRWTFSD